MKKFKKVVKYDCTPREKKQLHIFIGVSLFISICGIIQHYSKDFYLYVMMLSLIALCLSTFALFIIFLTRKVHYVEIKK